MSCAPANLSKMNADEHGNDSSKSELVTELTDPRRREPKYALLDMIVMTVCAVFCATDDFVAVRRYVRTKKE